MGKKWVFRKVSHDDFLSGLRSFHVPEEAIKILEEMAPQSQVSSDREVLHPSNKDYLKKSKFWKR